MEKQSENQFFKVEFKSENNCVYHTWKPTTKSATWNDIKSAFIKYVDIIKSNKPRNIIVDERNMGHVFSPDSQKWIDSTMMPDIISSGAKRIAIVQSSDGFVELATELLMEEQNSSKLQVRFVRSVEEAETWVLK